MAALQPRPPPPRHPLLGTGAGARARTRACRHARHTRACTHGRARRFQQTSDTQARSWKTPTCLFHLRSLTKPQSPAPMGEMCQQKGTCEGAPALCEIVKCLTGPRHVFGNPINTPGPFECL